MTKKFMKYTFICDPDTCDALVEITCKTEPRFTWCMCCGKPLTAWISVTEAEEN